MDSNDILANNIDYAENINYPDVLLENIVLLPIVSTVIDYYPSYSFGWATRLT